MGSIKKKIKKITAVHLIVVGTMIAVSNIQPHVIMASEKAKLVVNENKVTDASKYGYLRTESNKNSKRNKKEVMSGRSVNRKKDYDLPSSFGSMSKAVKDQKPWGTCWIFSAIGTMEYAADKKESGDHTFSEESMLRTFTKRSDTGWQIISKNNGGNQDMGAGYLTSHGAVSSNLVYDKKNPIMELPYMNSQKETAYRATDVQFFGKDYKSNGALTDQSIQEVKKAVYETGSAETMIKWNYLYIKGNSLNNMNEDARDRIDHAVVVIGWDDNYKKTNFIQQPKKDGAFLIRNSWGDKMGDHGYYWVSYEDKSLLPAFSIRDYEKTTSDETIYNLEEGALCEEVEISDKKTAGYVNVFDLKNKESLDKVTFYSPLVGAQYQIYYVPVENNGNLNLNGMKAITEAKETTYGGYHTEQIKQPIIKKGKVAIMVAVRSSGKDNFIGAEGVNSTSNQVYVSKISKGESYLVTDCGVEDMYKEKFGNWTIKMTTKQASDRTVTADNDIKDVKIGITKKEIGLHTITSLILDADEITYNGKDKKPDTIVSTNEDELLSCNSDYDVVYENNKNIGEAKVTIKGTGIFLGSVTKKFWIHPDKVRSLKVRRKGKVTTVRYKKNKGGVTGYRIQYSTQKNMRHSKYITTKKNVYKIKSNRKVYVRVKAYKKVGNKKVYSLKWSN